MKARRPRIGIGQRADRPADRRLDRVDLRDDVEAVASIITSITPMIPTRTPYRSGRAPSSRCSVKVTNITAAIA
jgi:hypothetical protein